MIVCENIDGFLFPAYVNIFTYILYIYIFIYIYIIYIYIYVFFLDFLFFDGTCLVLPLRRMYGVLNPASTDDVCLFNLHMLEEATLRT